MSLSNSSMDSEQFQKVAAQCNWSERSLLVAKALVVERSPVTQVAEAHTMTPQQANMIRKRFIEKAERLRVEEFMKREKPKSDAALLPYSSDIFTLRDGGYTVSQIVLFLKENDVLVSKTIVESFLKKRSKRK